MTTWKRISGGWALNLDGSDAAATFALPRLEVRASPQGWRSECLHADGRRGELAPPCLGGAVMAMSDALANAKRLLGPAGTTGARPPAAPALTD